MKVYKCDFCETEEHVTHNGLKLFTSKYDICGKCADKVQDWLVQFPHWFRKSD